MEATVACSPASAVCPGASSFSYWPKLFQISIIRFFSEPWSAVKLLPMGFQPHGNPMVAVIDQGAWLRKPFVPPHFSQGGKTNVSAKLVE